MKKQLLLIFLVILLVCCVGCNNTPVTYTVKWYDQNGNLLTTTSVDENSTPSYNYQPSDTAEYHYEFLGWSATKGGQILSAVPNAAMDAEYYACVRAIKKSYTITFDSNGGSLVDSITVEYGSVAVAPQKPYLDEKRFVCWCTDASLTTEVNWSAPITGNVTYYAKWTDELSNLTKCTISWFDENGKLLNQSSVAEGVVPSYQYDLMDTAEYHYEFLGWSTTPDSKVLSVIPTATGNASYYANVKSTKNKYTITFDSNGGTKVNPIVVEYGTVISNVPKAEYDGHKFVSWCTDSALSNSVDWSRPIKANATYYAKWNITINLKEYLNALVSGYKLDPYSYLPESMRPSYQENLIATNDVVTDYTNFVKISNITSQGFGDQWHMVLDNIKESQNFFNVLSVVETVSSGAVTAFNNYFDSNPSETARHTIKNGIYSTTIDYDGTSLYFVVEYTDTIPVFGEQSVQIALSLNIENGQKTSRIQIGDSNALRYTIKEDSYEFDIKYLGVRCAHFDVSKDKDGNVSGHINEFITATDSIEKASAADFYINDKYVIAVGNKTDAYAAFTGYIAETYNVTTGKLLGYEVQETQEKLSITYNTLWFDLCNVDGITSIKQDADKNIYINGSSSKWESKKVGGLSLKTASRRFDIEFRTQYFYTYDAENEKYVEVKASVPMLFIQQENFDTFADDVESTNKVMLTVTTAETALEAIIDHYTTLIPVFIENKDKVTSVEILEYIGEKITF